MQCVTVVVSEAGYCGYIGNESFNIEILNIEQELHFLL